MRIAPERWRYEEKIKKKEEETTKKKIAEQYAQRRPEGVWEGGRLRATIDLKGISGCQRSLINFVLGNTKNRGEKGCGSGTAITDKSKNVVASGAGDFRGTLQSSSSGTDPLKPR